MGEEFEFGDLVVILSPEVELQHPEGNIYLSLNSKYLPSYEGGVVLARAFDTDESLELNMPHSYVRNYRRYLGIRFIHLSDLHGSGFLNTSYDLSFCFNLEDVLQAPHLIADGDAIQELLLQGINTGIQKLYKETYEHGDEVLVRELDLKKAKYALKYGAINLEQPIDKVRVYDLSDLRKRAVDLYLK